MNAADSNTEFEALLRWLEQICNFDLTAYRPDSLLRRLHYRMQQLEIENYGQYMQYVQTHSEERVLFVETILINVSGFFRDRDSWNYLAHKIIPQIITNKQPEQKIRIWSAGCASGQEVYTLIMLLVEALGIEQYLERVQIFATDVNEGVLQRARQGSYRNAEITDIPSELLSKYFQQTKQGYVFHPKLRSSIIFALQDLAVDAPMSKIDLLVCRNVLIYFKPEIQATILIRFHFSLNHNGILFLGNAESLSTHRQIFMPLSMKHRMFAKGQKLSVQEHLLIQPKTNRKKTVDPFNKEVYIWQAAFENSPFAQLAIDRSNRLLAANKNACTLFGLQNTDLSKYLQNLEVGKIVNLTLLRSLYSRRQGTYLHNLKWVANQQTFNLVLHIIPVIAPSGQLLGANLTFIDINQYFG